MAVFCHPYKELSGVLFNTTNMLSVSAGTEHGLTAGNLPSQTLFNLAKSNKPKILQKQNGAAQTGGSGPRYPSWNTQSGDSEHSAHPHDNSAEQDAAREGPRWPPQCSAAHVRVTPAVLTARVPFLFSCPAYPARAEWRVCEPRRPRSGPRTCTAPRVPAAPPGFQQHLQQRERMTTCSSPRYSQ